MNTYTFVLGHIKSGHMIDYTIQAVSYAVAKFLLLDEYPEDEYTLLGFSSKATTSTVSINKSNLNGFVSYDVYINGELLAREPSYYRAVAIVALFMKD